MEETAHHPPQHKVGQVALHLYPHSPLLTADEAAHDLPQQRAEAHLQHNDLPHQAGLTAHYPHPMCTSRVYHLYGKRLANIDKLLFVSYAVFVAQDENVPLSSALIYLNF